MAYLFVIAQAGSLQVMPIVQNTDPFIVVSLFLFRDASEAVPRFSYRCLEKWKAVAIEVERPLSKKKLSGERILPMTKAPTYPILFAHHKNTSSTYDSYSGNIFFITVPCER